MEALYRLVLVVVLLAGLAGAGWAAMQDAPGALLWGLALALLTVLGTGGGFTLLAISDRLEAIRVLLAQAAPERRADHGAERRAQAAPERDSQAALDTVGPGTWTGAKTMRDAKRGS